MTSELSPSRSVMPMPNTISLSRTDPKRNMARFYGLSVERDLFGHVVLVRH